MNYTSQVFFNFSIMLSIEEQIANQIKQSQNILIIFGKNWDGDSISSSLAFFLILQKLNKNSIIVCEHFLDDHSSQKFNFLPEFNKISNALSVSDKFIISLDIKNAKVENIKYELKKNKLNFIINPINGSFSKNDVTSKQDINYDLIITLNTPDLKSLGGIYENNLDFFYDVPIINIDNNSQNENFGQINFIELTKSSVCEIIFYLFYKNDPRLIDKNIATCLLTGIISKTKNFKTLNIYPNTLASAAKLISLEARREEIVKHLYISRDIRLMKMLGNILSGLNSRANDKLIWFNLNDDKNISELPKPDINSFISEVINELTINIPQVEIIIAFFTEKNNGQKANFALIYSTKHINALELAHEFKPTGTKTSALINFSKPIDEVKDKILNKITENLKKIT